MCTRILSNADTPIITARTFDFPESTNPIIYILPRNIERKGSVKNKPLVWTSIYGSVITAAYRGFTMDGMNEEGLGCHFLNLVGSKLPKLKDETENIQVIQVSQYVLDMCANTKEIKTALTNVGIEPVPLPKELPGDEVTMHLAFEDKNGDSIIVEFIDGEIQFHEGRENVVMTNDPKYELHIENMANYDFTKAAMEMTLPGNVAPKDRFIRASYFQRLIPKGLAQMDKVMSLLAVARNVSVPFGAPYRSFGTYDTHYRTVVDSTNRIYYWESTRGPNLFHIDLNEIDFENNEVKELDPMNTNLYSKVNNEFKNSTNPY